jgi:hypothetical protein
MYDEKKIPLIKENIIFKKERKKKIANAKILLQARLYI